MGFWGLTMAMRNHLECTYTKPKIRTFILIVRGFQIAYKALKVNPERAPFTRENIVISRDSCHDGKAGRGWKELTTYFLSCQPKIVYLIVFIIDCLFKYLLLFGIAYARGYLGACFVCVSITRTSFDANTVWASIQNHLLSTVLRICP